MCDTRRLGSRTSAIWILRIAALGCREGQLVHLLYNARVVFVCATNRGSSTASQFDRVHKWLGFTESEVEFEHRQAAEATLLILSSQIQALSRLAEAMALGRSVGFCIDTIEQTLNLINKL